MAKNKGKRKAILAKILALVVVSLILFWIWQTFPGYELDGNEAVVEKAYYERQSGLMVEVSGEVFAQINQDKSNKQHQEFKMRLPSGQLLLVVHKNDIDGWIPLENNDTVTVRGQYTWSETGGIIHGTQRDSSMKRLHGWVEHGGVRYD
jgi:hypothetical protein